MLSNSLVAALVASAYVLALVLQLNPTLPLGPSRLVPIAMTVGLFYAFHLTVLFYVVLEPSTVRQITNGAVTLVVSAAFFVFVALLRAHMGSTGRPIWSALFVAT